VLAREGEPDLIFDPGPPGELQKGTGANFAGWFAVAHLAIFGFEFKACREICGDHRMIPPVGDKRQPVPDPLGAGQEMDKAAPGYLNGVLAQIEMAVHRRAQVAAQRVVMGEAQELPWHA
jgi:hypothetical protein